jgi:hypothetical protein
VFALIFAEPLDHYGGTLQKDVWVLILLHSRALAGCRILSGVLLDSVEKNVNEKINYFGARLGQVITGFEQNLDLSLIPDHSQERPGRHRRIDLSESSFGDTALDVLADIVSDLDRGGLKKDVGQLMAFEGSKQQQSHERGISAIQLELAGRDDSEELAIIISGRDFFKLGLQVLRALLRLEIDNGAIQVALCREMAEDDGFAYPGAIRYFLSGGTAKAFLGKQVSGDFDNLLPPDFT